LNVRNLNYVHLIFGLAALGFGLAVIGCAWHLSAVVSLGFLVLGVLQIVAIFSALRSGTISTNWGVETKTATPIAYWFTITLFGSVALVWTVVWLWLLISGSDVFKYQSPS